MSRNGYLALATKPDVYLLEETYDPQDESGRRC
jgi:hypothetical protein